MPSMADHYAKALEHLDEVAVKRADLIDEYADPHLRRSQVIAQLHQDIGRSMKLATIHAELATGQAIRDVAAALDRHVDLPIAYTIPAARVEP